MVFSRAIERFFSLLPFTRSSPPLTTAGGMPSMIFTDIQKMFLFPLYSKIKRKEKRRKVPAGSANGSIVPSCLSLVSLYFFSLFRLCFQNKPLLRFTWKMMEFFLHFCLPLYSTAERWINRPVYRRKASS